MAERSKKVQERVREELDKNPGAGTRELQEAAQSVEPSVADLSLRQFNAGYVLPLKRRGSKGRKKDRAKTPRKQTGRREAPAAAAAPAKRASRGRGAESERPEGERERVRAALLDFAREFSEAESRSAIVAVLADLDRYVDRIVGSQR